MEEQELLAKLKRFEMLSAKKQVVGLTPAEQAEIDALYCEIFALV